MFHYIVLFYAFNIILINLRQKLKPDSLWYLHFTINDGERAKYINKKTNPNEIQVIRQNDNTLLAVKLNVHFDYLTWWLFLNLL